MHQFGEWKGPSGQVRDIGNFRPNWDQVVLTGELHAIAGKVYEDDGTRSSTCDLVCEVTNDSSKQALIKIARTNDVKSRRLQGQGDQGCIAYGGSQGLGFVRSIADYERQPLFRHRRACRAREQAGKGRQKNQKSI